MLLELMPKEFLGKTALVLLALVALLMLVVVIQFKLRKNHTNVTIYQSRTGGNYRGKQVPKKRRR